MALTAFIHLYGTYAAWTAFTERCGAFQRLLPATVCEDVVPAFPDAGLKLIAWLRANVDGKSLLQNLCHHGVLAPGFPSFMVRRARHQS